MEGGGEARDHDPVKDAKRCVTDLIDHMITESKNLYKGTDMENKFAMFHDALAQWNEKEAQEYIEQNYPGFTGRFIKPVGTTCAATIYKEKPPGNSPENARGLDSYGVADLEYAMCFNCALPCTPTVTHAGSSARGPPRRCGTS